MDGVFSPPLTGIGHYVHRLIGAMLPLLEPEEQLLVYNWRLSSIDLAYYEHVEIANSGQAHGEQAGVPLQNKIQAMLRQKTLLRKAFRVARAVHFHSAEKNFDLFHAVNYVPPFLYGTSWCFPSYMTSPTFGLPRCIRGNE